MENIKSQLAARIKSATVIATIAATAACGLVPSGSQNAPGQDNANILPSSTNSSGGVSALYDASSTDTKVLAADGAISGATLTLPPGSLATSMDISIQSDNAIVDSSIVQQLSLGDDNSISQAGPAVNIGSASAIDASQPMTLAIPLNGMSLTSSQDNLVIIYNVVKGSADGEAFMGMIINSELMVEDGQVRFQTQHFGVFQPAYLAQPVATRPAEVPGTAVPSISQRGEANGVWKTGCRVDDHQDSNEGDGSSESATGNETQNSGPSSEMFMNSSMTIAGDRFTHQMNMYMDDPTCSSASLVMIFKSSGTHTYGNAVAKPAGAREWDFKFGKSYFIPTRDDIAYHYSMEKQCGLTNWQAWVPQLLPPEGCVDHDDEGNSKSDGPMAKPGDIMYTIYAVDGDNLWMGRDDVEGEEYGHSPDNRPLYFENEPLKRQ